MVLSRGWSLIRGTKVSPAQREFMVSGLERGYSVSAVIKTMKGTPYAIRREVGLTLAREIRGIADAGRNLMAIPYNKRPSVAAFQVSSRSMFREYRYWGKVVTKHIDTGAFTSVDVNFSSDERMTRGQIESIFQDIAEDFEDQYGTEFDSVIFTGAERRA